MRQFFPPQQESGEQQDFAPTRNASESTLGAHQSITATSNSPAFRSRDMLSILTGTRLFRVAFHKSMRHRCTMSRHGGLGKYLRGESLKPRALLPGVIFKSRFAASLPQESFAVPLPLHRDLGQQ